MTLGRKANLRKARPREGEALRLRDHVTATAASRDCGGEKRYLLLEGGSSVTQSDLRETKLFTWEDSKNLESPGIYDLACLRALTQLMEEHINLQPAL